MAHRASVATHGGHGGHPGSAAGEHLPGHPGQRTYINIAIILAIITIVEVATYYIEWMADSGVLVPTLIVLSAAKFVTVVGYFMHLKFDDRRLTWIFAVGLVISLAIVISLKILMDVHPIDYALRLLTGGE